MNSLSRTNDPSGLKLQLAADFTESKVIRHVSDDAPHQAVLEVTSESGRVVHLRGNSAVLYLMKENTVGSATNSNIIDMLPLLESEIRLQNILTPFLASLLSGRSDSLFKGALIDVLKVYDDAFSDLKAPQKPLAADVVLYCSLLPLTAHQLGKSILDGFPRLLKYLNEIGCQAITKNCVESYYPHGITLKPWATCSVAAVSPSVSSLSLLKKAVDDTMQTSNSPIIEENGLTEITSEELIEVTNAWVKGPTRITENKSANAKILPMANKRNILVTSALPYVNNVPHLGNIIGCVLSADVFSRFCRLRGDNLLFICGTDEYGTATETKAMAEGITPKQLCDKYHAIHSDVYRWFNISFDFFGRTTTEKQTKVAQDIFWSLEKNGKICRNSVDQMYCLNCKMFLADRFIEGICPYPGCGALDARGDQCDKCGHLINAVELGQPQCKICSQTPEVRTSKHLFLDLPLIEEDLKKWIADSSPQWTSNAKTICDSWIRDGLQTRCITRDLKWGTPVPLDGYTDKVFYVWFDAPIGYVSMTASYTEDWEKWWKNPSQVLYYEYMAKDNVPFHSVVFPCTQLGTEENWTKVTHLIATEYFNYEDRKFSKSKGVGVFGDQAMETGICSDVWRFYLLYMRPETQDTSFSWTDLQLKNNSELLNNVGNFVNRALKFVYQFYDGLVPEVSPTESDFQLMAAVNREYHNYLELLGSNSLKDGLRSILAISRLGNQYIQENEPYKLIKPERSDADKLCGGTVVGISVNMVALLALTLEPYMPDTANTIYGFLNFPSELNHFPSHFTQLIASGQKINQPTPLVRKITDEEIVSLRARFAGNQEEDQKKALNSSEFKGKQNVASNDPNPMSTETLDQEILSQGQKVRELKLAKADKDIISVQVTKLLQLKEQLSKLKGDVNPTTAVTNGGKSKKNKKK